MVYGGLLKPFEPLSVSGGLVVLYGARQYRHHPRDFRSWPILKNPIFRSAQTSCAGGRESQYAFASRSL